MRPDRRCRCCSVWALPRLLRAPLRWLLAARLAERARTEQLAKVAEIRGEKHEAGWGRQIRSYVLQPYQMVKDLRTDFEIGNVQGVLDGDIDGLIDSYLHWRRSELYEA